MAPNVEFCYNTVMRSFLSLTLATTLLFSAAPAVAQEEDDGAPILSIEDVLLQQALNGEIPINGRMAERIRLLQEERARLLAEKAQQELMSRFSSAVTEHAAAPAEETAMDKEMPENDDTVTVSANGKTLVLSAADVRLLDRLQRNRTTNFIRSTALHSGAPLAGTGLETVLTLCALALAVGLTFMRAWMLEKRDRHQ